jgi:hypothetical protein
MFELMNYNNEDGDEDANTGVLIQYLTWLKVNEILYIYELYKIC